MITLIIRSEYDDDQEDVSTHASPDDVKKHIKEYVADEMENFDSEEEFWAARENKHLSTFMKEWDGTKNARFDAYPYVYTVKVTSNS